MSIPRMIVTPEGKKVTNPEYKKLWEAKNPNYYKEYRIKNAKKIKEYGKVYTKKKWAERTIEDFLREQPGRAERYWRSKGIIGLTWSIYQKALKEQDNKCKICKKEFKPYVFGLKRGKANTGRPNADHCHKTGRFRGVLCGTCNMAYGVFEILKEGFNNYDN